jgi:adenylate cyclase
VATDRVERRMAAIVAADMVGYSRLMEADETGTLAALKAPRRELIDSTMAAHNGRIVKTTGDGMLVEFASVVDAVASAVAVQRAMLTRNEAVPKDRRIQFRVGVNLGDIIIDDDDIYGDGVNIAARLEQLAEPGGVCISGTVYDQLKAQVDVGYADLGEQSVKNIKKPVRAYRVLLDAEKAGKIIAAPQPRLRRWQLGAVAALMIIIAAGGLAWWQPWIERVEPASLDRMAFPLPDKPSIAVLPFANLTGDPEQNVLSDGISENITTALSRVPDVFVIARTSTLVYKGKPVKVQQVAEDLGVRYVLEGSLQRSGDKVRVTAQLIDALKGHHLWAQRYDRKVKDSFALQDEITLSVLNSLEVKLTDDRMQRLRGNTNNLQAYQHFRHGYRIFFRFTKAGNAEARRLFEQAVELDPNYGAAWNQLGWTYQMAAKFGWAENPARAQARAIELAHKGLAIDPSAVNGYLLLSMLCTNDNTTGRLPITRKRLLSPRTIPVSRRFWGGP